MAEMLPLPPHTYLPGSFDCPPHNPAEKISSGYKVWKFLLYLYGLGPGVFSFHRYITSIFASSRGRRMCSAIASCLKIGFQRPSLLGDSPLHPTSPLIFLRHLCIFLLIIASPRRSALMAPIPESNDHVTQHSYHCFTILHLFSSFYYLSSFYDFNSDFLVYRHAFHLSRVLSFSFRIPCQISTKSSAVALTSEKDLPED